MISFSLITRNCEDTLPNTLRSIKSVADEIIIADTGSTDDTIEIARAFDAKVISLPEDKYPDKFVQIPKEDGTSRICLADFAWARNLSFDAANGDLVFWCDSVTGETPVLVRKQGDVFIDFVEIRDLVAPTLREKCNLIRKPEQYETLSRSGWTPIRSIKQHKVSKPIYRIIDDGDVKITGDHSLMSGGKEIAGRDVIPGTRQTPGTVLDHIHASQIHTLNIEPITEDLAEAWGFFAAEGSCRIANPDKPKNNRNRYLWYFSNTDQLLVDRFSRIFSEHHARRLYVVKSIKGRYIPCQRVCATDSKDLALFYRDRFYSSAGRKRVPKEILNASSKIIKAFLRGYELGDGHVRRYSGDGRPLQSWSTDSPLLAAGLIFLYQKIGRDLYCNPERKDKTHIVSCVERSGKPSPSGKGSCKRKVEGVRHIHIQDNFSGYVYDLNTEDGTFVGGVGQFVLHNSDDILSGLENWSTLVRTLNASEADGALLPYEYAYDAQGRVSTLLWRERLLKLGSGWNWLYPIHEVLDPRGKNMITYDRVRVCHQKDRRTDILKRRNIEILKTKCDPSDPRTLFYLGLEHTHNLEYGDAAKTFQQFIKVGKNQEEIAQAYVYLGDLFRVINKHEAAIEYYQKAIMLRPNWRDSYYGLAACCCAIEDWDRCLFFIQQGKALPEDPNTLLAFNPQHEKIGWAEWATRAHLAKGELEKSLACANEALQQNPGYEPIRLMHKELVRKINERESNRVIDELVEYLMRYDRGIEALTFLNESKLTGGPNCQLLMSIMSTCGQWELPGRTRTANLNLALKPDERLNWVVQEIQNDPTVRDIFVPGVGDGYLARAMTIALGAKVQCTDPDPEIVRQFWGHFAVKQAGPGVGPKEQADAVVVSGVLEHLYGVHLFLDTAREWIRNDGHLMVIVPNGALAPHGPPPSLTNMRMENFTPDRLRHLLHTDTLPQHVQGEGAENGYLCAHVRIGKPKVTPRSIGIFCPPALETWGPFSLEKGIGGSEESVIYLSRELARRGHEVVVYTDWQGQDGPVTYRSREEWGKHDICVGWRYPEIFTQRNPPEAEWRWLWMHDVLEADRVYAAMDRVDRLLVGSHFHKAIYPHAASLINVVRLGLVPEDFLPERPRNPCKFIYTSCPTRGLETILDVWPNIRQECQKAELHVFYDFINVNLTLEMSGDSPEIREMKEVKRRILEKSKQPGVFWRGRVGQEEIAREMRSSGVFSYPCKFPEVMAISAAKAQAAGCWPVYYPVAALPETLSYGIATTKERFVMDCVKATQAPEVTRQEMMKWAREVYSWERVADNWERLMMEG